MDVSGKVLGVVSTEVAFMAIDMDKITWEESACDTRRVLRESWQMGLMEEANRCPPPTLKTGVPLLLDLQDAKVKKNDDTCYLIVGCLFV